MQPRPKPFVCTEETPWREGLPTPVKHTVIREVCQEDGWPSGDIVTLECLVCKARWKEELPQIGRRLWISS